MGGLGAPVRSEIGPYQALGNARLGSVSEAVFGCGFAGLGAMLVTDFFPC